MTRVLGSSFGSTALIAARGDGFAGADAIGLTDANRERDRRDHDDERESGAGELVGEPVPVEIERDPDRPDAREHDEQRKWDAPVEDVPLGGAEHPGERGSRRW